MDGEKKVWSMEQPNIKNMNIHNKAHTCSLLNRGLLCTATVVTPKHKEFQGKQREKGVQGNALQYLRLQIHSQI